MGYSLSQARWRLSLCGAVVMLVLSVSFSEAQLRDSYWGLQADFTPTWRGDGLDPLFDASEMDISGSEFRLGFVRGRARAGHWGMSFVQKAVESGSFIDGNGSRRTALDDLRVVGVMLDAQSAFTTIRDRVQIGAVTGLGVGTARGTIAATENGIPIDAEPREFFRPFGYNLPVLPLARVELAVSVIVVPGLKLRASGGFNYPGLSKFSVGAVYFFGER